MDGYTIPPDNWCPHCEQNVYLTQGRHFCERMMAYLFGIELQPARPLTDTGDPQPTAT